jgi:hypothetical protein
MGMTKTEAPTITHIEPMGSITVATLSDGRSVIARNTGDRWTGKHVDVSLYDPRTMVIGDLVVLRAGTSHRLALDAALIKLA